MFEFILDQFYWIVTDCGGSKDVVDNVSIYNGLSSIVSISKEINLPFFMLRNFSFLMLVVVLVLVRS